MEDSNCFHNFVVMVVNRPHIAENIITRLSVCDIANCLRTSKDFRNFIVVSCQQNQRLTTDLNESFSRFFLTSNTLDAINYGLLEEPKWDLETDREHFCFGLDGSLWLSRPNFVTGFDPKLENPPPVWEYNYLLSIYDLKMKSKTMTVPLRYNNKRPRVTILPHCKVLVQDEGKFFTFSRQGKSATFNIDSTSDMCDMEFPPENFYGHDCTYQCVKKIKNSRVTSWNLSFCDSDGKLMTGSAFNIRNINNSFSTLPRQIFQKGHHVMIVSGVKSHITMFSTSSDKVIWAKSTPDHFTVQEWLLTETFSGLLYKEYDDGTHATGQLKLILYETSTGKEFYHESCWEFSHPFNDEYTDTVCPRAYADGNYIFICSTHGFKGEANPEEWQGNIAMCIKVNPITKECRVRKSSTYLESVLLAKTVLDEEERKMKSPSKYNESWRREPEIKVFYSKLNFLGFACKSVILFCAKYDYTNARQKLYKAKTVFSVNLDTLLDMYEPSALASAINFPLGHNVCDSFKEVPDLWPHIPIVNPNYPRLYYYPYFETRRQGQNEIVEITGIVEISGDPHALMPKLYDFTKFMEAMELPDGPNPAKRLRMNE